ncbi:IS66 family transposase [Desulfosporosinus metallidurans]|uniref:IS66 family transposase n=1 Tax=Desulfosporosinus metallidurans TaxID=1888891 RepID=UPI00094BFB0B|nr:transposase [Desulfosporosinus metallidurans]
MREKLLTYDIVMSDETTIQCNKEEGRKASSNSYFWLHRNGPCEGAPVILFQYTRTRAGENARKFLDGFSGYLITDYADKLNIPMFSQPPISVDPIYIGILQFLVITS